MLLKVARIDPLICLGIESTADNLGVGIASSDGKILANEVKVHVPDFGGIHPREVGVVAPVAAVDQLQQPGVTRVIVCGCTTDACVDMTARRAVSPWLAARLIPQ